jgi:hypothetical protein
MFYLIPKKKKNPRGEKGNASWQNEATITSQYANDIGFTIMGKEENIINLMKKFDLISNSCGKRK